MPVLLAGNIISPAQGLKLEADNYFNRVRTGDYPPAPDLFRSAGLEAEVLELLGHCLQDSSRNVRGKACEIAYAVSSRSSVRGLQQVATSILINALADDDRAIRTMAINLLEKCPKENFLPAAKDSLRRLIETEASPLDRLIKLAAFLELEDLIPLVRRWSQPGTPAHLRWSALQSLARMGEKDAAAEVMTIVKRLPVNDDVVYMIFPDLVFTRQPEPIAYVVKALERDEANCFSADVERAMPIPCGYRIMELLAPVIEGLPVELNASGDLKTDNYADALASVRQWFILHETYTINNDTF